MSRKTVLALRDVSDELLHRVTFELHEGEILGIAGLNGTGRTNILEIAFGARQPTTGQIELDGKVVEFHHPADAIHAGIALVTEDRKRDGMIESFPIWQTISLPRLRRFAHAGLLRLGRERIAAREATKKFDVRARSVDARMRELSGGNQQKVLLARSLSLGLRILLLDEPTHGVDIGAREAIYGTIRSAAADGVSIIVVSSEFDELERLCTRVLLLVEGQLVGELRDEAISKDNMLAALYARRARGKVLA